MNKIKATDMKAEKANAATFASGGSGGVTSGGIKDAWGDMGRKDYGGRQIMGQSERRRWRDWGKEGLGELGRLGLGQRRRG